MKIQTPTEFQTFNDGIVTIYSVGNNAAAGDAPSETLAPKEKLPFHRRTVGIKRMYLAMQAQAHIDLLLRCPYRKEVSAQDVAIPTLDGKQYRITAVQVPEDIWPLVMDLTLERLEADYDIA